MEVVEFLLRGLIPESPHFYCPNLGAGKKNICSNGRKEAREAGKRGREEGKRGREARKGQREEGKGERPS